MKYNLYWPYTAVNSLQCLCEHSVIFQLNSNKLHDHLLMFHYLLLSLYLGTHHSLHFNSYVPRFTTSSVFVFLLLEAHIRNGSFAIQKAISLWIPIGKFYNLKGAEWQIPKIIELHSWTENDDKTNMKCFYFFRSTGLVPYCKCLMLSFNEKILTDFLKISLANHFLEISSPQQQSRWQW